MSGETSLIASLSAAAENSEMLSPVVVRALLTEAACALEKQEKFGGKWRFIRMNQPAPEGDDFVVIASAEYEKWRERFKRDRDDQDGALRDSIRETAQLADEVAFYAYHAKWHIAYLIAIKKGEVPPDGSLLEDTPLWKLAELRLADLRVKEHQDRGTNVKAFREIGS